MREYQPGVIVASLGLLVIGIWIAARALGAPLMGLTRIWPALLLIGGLAVLAQARRVGARFEGSVFIGVALLLMGSLFCLFSAQIAGLSWQDMGRYWPLLLLIVGLALLIVYLAGDMQPRALPAAAYLVGGAGLLALPLTLGLVWSPAFGQVLRYWPILIVPFGLALFFRLRGQPSDS
ncbi:MAG: hypothetical protein Kow00124_06840 [Anaerolineae bacterium]